MKSRAGTDRLASMFNTPALSSTRFVIPDGKQGIFDTVNLMIDIVNKYKTNLVIRGLALSLVEFLPNKDERGEVETIFSWVQNHIRYVKDVHGVETVSTPDKTLEVMQGDCDDQSLLLACLLESIGHPTSFKIAGYNGDDFEHVYCVAFVQGEAIHMDATESEPIGWEPPDSTISAYL